MLSAHGTWLGRPHMARPPRPSCCVLSRRLRMMQFYSNLPCQQRTDGFSPGCRPPGARPSEPFRPCGGARGSGEVAVAVTVGIALVDLLESAFARPGAAERGGFELHEALGGKADHLAQERCIGALLQQRAKCDLVIGHRGGPRVRVASRNPTLPSTATVTTAVDKSPAYARLSTIATAGDLPTAPTPRPGARPRF